MHTSDPTTHAHTNPHRRGGLSRPNGRWRGRPAPCTSARHPWARIRRAGGCSLPVETSTRHAPRRSNIDQREVENRVVLVASPRAAPRGTITVPTCARPPNTSRRRAQGLVSRWESLARPHGCSKDEVAALGGRWRRRRGEGRSGRGVGRRGDAPAVAPRAGRARTRWLERELGDQPLRRRGIRKSESNL